MAPYATEDLPHPSLSMSGSSYSSSMDSDYEVHLAQVLHLVPRPVLLPERPASPYDQALPTILHEVTGTEDLKSVLELKLKVLSSELSLSKLHLYVPQLMVLDLSGSYLQSLRDLGCNLLNLKVLKVDRCSLDSLDGVFGLSSIIELSAAYNQIEDLSSAIFLEHLKSLNLRGNCISDLSFLEFLNTLPLEKLTLAENPAIRDMPGDLYVQTILDALHGLKTLDDRLVQVSPQPSTSSSIIHLPDVWAFKIRPQCPPNGDPNATSRPQSARPASVGPLVRKPARRLSWSDVLQESLPFPKPDDQCPVSRLTSGGVVCGNLTNALRQRRKRPRPEERASERDDVRVMDVDEDFDDTTSASSQEPCFTSTRSRENRTSTETSNTTPSLNPLSPNTSSGATPPPIPPANAPNELIVAARRWRRAFALFQEKSWESWRQHSIDSEDVSSEADDEDITEVSK